MQFSQGHFILMEILSENKILIVMFYSKAKIQGINDSLRLESLRNSNIE